MAITLQPIRRPPSPGMLSYIQSLTQPQTVQLLAQERRAVDLAARVEHACASVHHWREQRATVYEGLRQDAHQEKAQSRGQSTSMHGTCFGRHMLTLAELYTHGLLPAGARILQGGAGTFSWAHMDESVSSGIAQMARDIG